MKLFRCQVCDNIIYFENRTCGRCGHRLGYLPELEIMAALEPAGGESWTPLVGESGPRRFCANADYDVCNWLTTAEGQDRLCVACRHNDTIPDISQASHLTAWRDIELAKHRLFYSLLRWKLPLKTRAEDPTHGLAFEFLADPPHPSGPKVMTGHDDGVVTIALAEADSAEIERRRAELAEPYRSLLGHFRHEVGHHYWDILVRDGGKLEQCRAIFGDDTQDYEAALKRHYEQGAPVRLGGALRLGLRDLASVGGFRRNLGALPAHRRHARDGERVRAQDRAGCRQGGRAFRQAQLRPLRRRFDRADCRRLGAFRGRHEQRQSGDGQARSLPVHHRAGGRGEAALHSRPRAGRGAEGSVRAGDKRAAAGPQRGGGDLTNERLEAALSPNCAARLPGVAGLRSRARRSPRASSPRWRSPAPRAQARR